MSVLTAIFTFLIELLHYLSDKANRKNEDRAIIWSEIEVKRKELAEALAEGRVSDVAILRKELEALMSRYLRGIRSEERKARRLRRPGGGVGLLDPFYIGALVACLFLTGCWSSRPSTVFVLGERVNVVRPGSVLEIPELIKPARTWYLIDNVAIQHWLGIPVDMETREVVK